MKNTESTSSHEHTSTESRSSSSRRCHAARRNSEAQKRKVIDSLEALRRPLPESEAREEMERSGECAIAPRLVDLRDIALEASGEKQAEEVDAEEMARLRQELRMAHATCDLLQEEVHGLEEKALRALSEAGQLRRQLDDINHERRREQAHTADGEETPDAMRRRLHEAEEVNEMLTSALGTSEAEIARLGKTIDLLIRKIPGL